MDSEVFSRIRDYLADQLEIEPEKITPDSDIVNDFGADTPGGKYIGNRMCRNGMG